MTNITLYTSTRQCVADNYFLGYEGENKINKLIFKFDDGFRDGLGILNIQKGEEKGYLDLEKIDNTYELEVKSALLTKKGEITFQLSINEPDGTVIKYDAFQMTVKDSIDTDTEMPEDYPNWVDMANAKLAEVDEAIRNVETVIDNANNVASELLQAKENGEFNGKDGEDGVDGADGISSEITVKTNTETEYVLTVKDVNGNFDTPNLKGKDSEGGIVNETDPIYLADKPSLALKTEIPTKTSQLTNDSSFATESFVANKIAEAELSGGDVDLSGYATKDELNKKANIEDIPTKVSELDNDSGFMTDYEETDPTVPAHVKAIKETDITNWNNKQDVLTAGDNITIKDGVISASGSGSGGLTELPIASADTLGGIKVGEGLSITEDGILSALGGGTETGIGTVTEIFSGEANVLDTKYTLSQSIEDFDMVLVVGNHEGIDTVSNLIPTVLIKENYNVSYDVSCMVAGSDITRIGAIAKFRFKFEDNTNFVLTAMQLNGWGNASINKVYGIKLGSSGGSSYSETELLGEPAEYTVKKDATTIGQDLVLLDDVTKFKELNFTLSRRATTTGEIFNLGHQRLLVSDIMYNSTDTSSFDGSRFSLATKGVGNVGDCCAVWFKDGETLRIHLTISGDPNVGTSSYFRISSIKGINY